MVGLFLTMPRLRRQRMVSKAPGQSKARTDDQLSLPTSFALRVRSASAPTESMSNAAYSMRSPR